MQSQARQGYHPAHGGPNWVVIPRHSGNSYGSLLDASFSSAAGGVSMGGGGQAPGKGINASISASFGSEDSPPMTAPPMHRTWGEGEPGSSHQHASGGTTARSARENARRDSALGSEQWQQSLFLRPLLAASAMSAALAQQPSPAATSYGTRRPLELAELRTQWHREAEELMRGEREASTADHTINSAWDDDVDDDRAAHHAQERASATTMSPVSRDLPHHILAPGREASSLLHPSSFASRTSSSAARHAHAPTKSLWGSAAPHKHTSPKTSFVPGASAAAATSSSASAPERTPPLDSSAPRQSDAAIQPGEPSPR